MCALAFIFDEQTAVKEGILKGNYGFPLSLLLCLLSCRSKKVRAKEVCAYSALDSNRLISNVPPARLKLSTAEGRGTVCISKTLEGESRTLKLYPTNPVLSTLLLSTALVYTAGGCEPPLLLVDKNFKL
jgi:hypothetical protein